MKLIDTYKIKVQRINIKIADLIIERNRLTKQIRINEKEGIIDDGTLQD